MLSFFLINKHSSTVPNRFENGVPFREHLMKFSVHLNADSLFQDSSAI